MDLFSWIFTNCCFWAHFSHQASLNKIKPWLSPHLIHKPINTSSHSNLEGSQSSINICVYSRLFLQLTILYSYEARTNVNVTSMSNTYSIDTLDMNRILISQQFRFPRSVGFQNILHDQLSYTIYHVFLKRSYKKDPFKQEGFVIRNIGLKC